MEAVVVFDADNTLWDTDSVFRSAQLALLQRFADAGLIHDVETELQTLRRLDAELGEQYGRAEYDFRVLIAALAKLYSRELSSERDARRIPPAPQSSGDPELTRIADEAFKAFQDGLRAV